MVLSSIALAMHLTSAQPAISCFSVAHRFYTAQRAAEICRDVGSQFCFRQG